MRQGKSEKLLIEDALFHWSLLNANDCCNPWDHPVKGTWEGTWEKRKGWNLSTSFPVLLCKPFLHGVLLPP